MKTLDNIMSSIALRDSRFCYSDGEYKLCVYNKWIGPTNILKNRLDFKCPIKLGFEI